MKTDFPEPKKFPRLLRWVRMLIYLPVVVVIVFFVVRRLEFMATYHPEPYVPGPDWTLPANGEEVWVKVSSGERVHGWFLRAIDQPAIATVLHCHGNGGNLSNVVWVAQELTKRGFDTMIFDYRGYGRSEGRLTDEWGLYADAEAVYDHLVRERGVKAEKLALYGQSLGTTAAIDLASRLPCGALIVESGLSSASDMGRVSFPWMPRQLHFLAKNRFESARKIANVKCPALITHGTSDAVIPVDQGRKLYESARDPKRLIIIEGGDHFLFGSGGEQFVNGMVDFIRTSVSRGK
ncbi:MAG: alpha/beta hydrolase [Blastocatellia bacterium]|nr:alpha/beta hydrolase [Blastocatellia bacterium]